MSPSTFGQYELSEKIATGGMAEVYRARMRRPGGVSKVVCLKRIHPSLCADPTFVSMFVEEARLGCTLSHGNIVPVFDYGCVDGYHFLVMDYLSGHDLAEVIARTRIVSRPFPLDLAIFVVDEVLEGLAYAHGKRDEAGQPLELVHRDISPSNVMISEAGEVKILDFGIARSALRDFKTRTGVVKGKPGYMAPEQALGGPVDARTDIYAAGVMLYELLTGRRPSADDKLTGPGAFQEDLPEVDEHLGEVIGRAMEPSPEDRYASALEMSRALHDILDAGSLRPTPSELARFVGSLFDTPAATPDWSHRAEAIDKNLAALVDEQLAFGDTEPGEPGEPAPESSPSTEQLERPPADEVKGPSTEQLDRPSADEVEGPSTEQLGDNDRGWVEVAASPGTEGLEPRPAAPIRRSKAGILFAVAAILVLLGGAAAVFGLTRPGVDTGGPPPSAAEIAPPTRPAPATLEVRTRPEGAEVIIDDQETGQVTPTELELSRGSHRIRIFHQGYQVERRRIEAHPGQLVVLDVTLTPVTGTLSITSDPPGAEVLLDGRSSGETPVELTDLERDRGYRVKLALADHEPWEREVSLDGAERREIKAALVRSSPRSGPPGFLSVNVHPWAEVVIDGRSWGTTPIIRRALRPGRHVLVLRNPARGVEQRRVVNIRGGEESRVSVDLVNGG